MRVKLSGSFRRYTVAPQPAKWWSALPERLPELLHEHRFRSIDTASNEIRSLGWTLPDGTLPGDFETAPWWLGRVLHLGVRIDQKRIPAGALKVRRLEAEAAERTQVGERIPPARRREILEKLESELMSRTVPGSAVYGMLLDTRTGRVMFGSTADAVNAAFGALFRETFEVPLLGLTAASLGDHLALPQAAQDALETARPEFGQPVGAGA